MEIIISFNIAAALTFGFAPVTPKKSRPINVSITCKSLASTLPPREFGSISLELVRKYKISFVRYLFSIKSFEATNFSYNSDNLPVLSCSIAMYMSGTLPMVLIVSPSCVLCCVSDALTGNQNSLIFL